MLSNLKVMDIANMMLTMLMLYLCDQLVIYLLTNQ